MKKTYPLVDQVPTEAGVYTTRVDIKVFKSFRSHEGVKTVRQVIIPAGADICVPRGQSSRSIYKKFRTNRMVLMFDPPGGLSGPHYHFNWKKGMNRGRLDRNVRSHCSHGFHACWNRYQASQW